MNNAFLRQMIREEVRAIVKEEIGLWCAPPILLQPTGDRIDDIAQLLRIAGKPMHITTIAAKLSEISGQHIKRTAIEPGLNRHVSQVKRKRIEKFGRSIFGLPNWKEKPSSYLDPRRY